MVEWFLAFSKPRQEERARLNIERQGHPTYLPKILETRRRRGAPVDRIGPLFPRYIFFQADDIVESWAPLRSTYGVTTLVRFGSTIAKVPEDLIAWLKGCENEKGLHVMVPHELQSGDAVNVTEGPMEGLEGIFVARSGRERALILLNVLGRRNRVQVPLRCLEPSH